VEESRILQNQAARWNRAADLAGILVGLLVLLIAGALIWWLNRHAFRPVLELGAAMERFGQGDVESRAPETGPPELRLMVGRFNQMASALAAQRRAQAAFLAGVAHDLRTPLGVLKLQLDFVHADSTLPSEPVIRRTVTMISHQITRLERMLGDLIDLTGMESGKLQLQLAEKDVREAVNAVVDLFQAAATRNPITCTIPPDPVLLRCDPLRLEQVITNLVSNAVKYSPKSGRVDVALYREGTDIVVEVTDRGVGISPKDQAHLFEPFRRVGLSMDTIPGAGLGLFMVRRIVEAHGGRVVVSSAAGAGSSFRIFLPDAGPPSVGGSTSE
jgi:two-component system, OmpR family, sensor histidine kinase MtrB